MSHKLSKAYELLDLEKRREQLLKEKLKRIETEIEQAEIERERILYERKQAWKKYIAAKQSRTWRLTKLFRKTADRVKRLLR